MHFMSLKNLLDDLKQSNDYEAFRKRIILPKELYSGNDVVKFHDGNYGKSPHRPHLTISGHIDKHTSNFQSLFTEFFNKAKETEFEKDSVSGRYRLYWVPTNFQDETSLGSEDIKIDISAYEKTPETPRSVAWSRPHGFRVETKGNEMNLTAYGGYKPHLIRIASERGFSSITLEKLTKSELEIFRESGLSVLNEGKSEELVDMGFIPGAMIMKDSHNLSLNLRDTGKEMEKIKKILEEYVADPYKPIKSNKKYGKDETSRREMLSDAQFLADKSQKINLGMVYDKPLITKKEAIGVAEREFDFLENAFNVYFLPNQKAIILLDVLIKEHLGGKFQNQLRFVNDSKETIDFLKKYGYKKPLFNSKKTGNWHLARFLKDKYYENPESYIDKVMEFYKNEKEPIKIVSETNNCLKKNRRNFLLPSKAKLLSLGFEDYNRSDDADSSFDNSLNNIELSGHSNLEDSIFFFLRADSVNPTLLALQEYVAGQLNIGFT